MMKNTKKLKEEPKKKIVTNVEVSYEVDDNRFFQNEEDYSVEIRNYDTYILCEKNQRETGWFYPDEDLEFLDTIIDENNNDEEI